MKTMLSGDKFGNWLNQNIDRDNNRLMIGYIRYSAHKGANEVNMVGREAIFEGGMKVLKKPAKRFWIFCMSTQQKQTSIFRTGDNFIIKTILTTQSISKIKNDPLIRREADRFTFVL